MRVEAAFIAAGPSAVLSHTVADEVRRALDLARRTPLAGTSVAAELPEHRE